MRLAYLMYFLRVSVAFLIEAAAVLWQFAFLGMALLMPGQECLSITLVLSSGENPPQFL